MTAIEAIVRTTGETAQYVGNNLASHAGGTAGTNPSGEEQIAADDWADEIFFQELSKIEGVGSYASEEREDAVDCGEGYAVAIDPLDGSSNLAVNNSVGTIVGVYDADLPATGRNLVAAAMVLYGPFTTMIVAREDADEVSEYLLRDGFVERWGSVTVPDERTVVGLAGKPSERSEAVNAIAEELERELKLRYGGATVADLGQVLEYGGLFGYPATSGYPDGKLRVHYESAPLAYIVETAGGASTDGGQSLLDVDPDGLHARTPTFLGNEDLVDRLASSLPE